MKNPIPGWQTVKSAAKSARMTRQRIHQLIIAKVIESRTIGRDTWVPEPLGYTPDRQRQKRAIQATRK